ncbi:uncharacterized protein BDR25DRAFT_367608 [Lindgomyces ingoldianus]|uniref:Uncharacterized protein n=1 Tax=Lindgomyces ingoldianus TaxID=673940 RepID=A0ACB6QXJ7_9PLEO|nr:uncharacterized protein BDR25DRAFT_367608 [Lindgomyces ingoldianus]KAF2471759.1 hypothetical protein BDR25DRAFT_367608 [Lindgomyces ingoldianus]
MASEALILEMLANPPDINEPQPLSNRKATIFGTTVGFLAVTWMAVALRLYTRVRIVREAGWDDFLVTVASVCNTAATVCVLLSIEYGLGRHFLYLPLETMSKYLKIYYIESAIYVSNTTIIKASLLVQYLRIFKAGTMRWVCVSLLVIISIWGLTYGFMAWVPCFPVSGYWNRKLNPKCYAYGFESKATFIATYETHTALNMAFDIAVFLTPMVLFQQQGMRRKSILALAGLFLFGAVVVFTSVWRLYTIIVNKAATHPYIDFTWWTPVSVILSCLEIDLAIICASMPIFWPVLEKSFSHIFVTHEVHITEHRRLNETGLEYELDHAESRSERAGSLKSTSAVDPFKYYTDQYVIKQVDPLAQGNIGVETNVQTEPKPKWRI